MKFNGITKKGREYLAKIQAENKPINFSKIKIGDGRLDNYDNPAELEHLINQKVEKGILTLNQEHDTVILTTNIDNVSLRTGYYPREIGVFVNDNGQEIMYYYMNDGDETSWIPPETDGPFKIELKLNLIASNAQSIVVEGVGKDLYITKEFLETNYTQKGGYTGTAQEIDDRVVSALGKEDGKFPLTEAVKGNVYYFPGNKKFYICKEAQNRRVSVPDGNFEELSIWENRKRLENLYKNFEQSGNWYYKQISSNFYMLFTWIPNIPGGESYYDLPFPTTSEYTNSLVLATQTGAGAVRPITCYIKNRKLYFNSQNTTKENYSIFAIVQV
nr:MAG TPA: tail-collar fiber protein [Caudoviricetes sp.]